MTKLPPRFQLEELAVLAQIEADCLLRSSHADRDVGFAASIDAVARKDVERIVERRP